MSIWDKMKKKPTVPASTEYHREKGRYEKPENEKSPVDHSDALNQVNDDALKQLYEDQAVKARLKEELAACEDNEKKTFGQMLGKGAATLGESLKKVSTGQDLLDENPQRKDSPNQD